MTNTELFERTLASKGIKKAFLAKQLGISYNALRQKINNQSSWKATEMMVVCDVLNIDISLKECIFFATTVGKMPTNN